MLDDCWRLLLVCGLLFVYHFYNCSVSYCERMVTFEKHGSVFTSKKNWKSSPNNIKNNSPNNIKNNIVQPVPTQIAVVH